MYRLNINYKEVIYPPEQSNIPNKEYLDFELVSFYKIRIRNEIVF